MSERRTEVDGWHADWRIDRHRIRIMLVRNLSEAQPLLSAATPAVAPDLADLRERFPELSRLWDAIRHEYWVEFFVPQEHSQGTI
ncbi:hypothetical protein ACQPXH_15235 [Nocardia sp. CA-135953]|uniref:hypothetical protein n=1 Tax=Nocardia sp. CA-135953 TaxID=3239978 RepID=UPI003D95B335